MRLFFNIGDWSHGIGGDGPILGVPSILFGPLQLRSERASRGLSFIEEENVPRDRDVVSRDPGGVGGTPLPPPLRGPPQDLHVTWEGGLYIERRFDSVFPRFLLKYVVQSLYNNHRTAHQWVVAFKGGHVEKDLLRELKIPFVNLVITIVPKSKTY